MTIKTCSSCSVIKASREFPKNSSSKDGFYSVCKTCKNQRNKEWKSKNAARERYNNAMHFQAHKGVIAARRNQYRQQNINYKLASNLRARLNKALVNGSKSGSAVRDLGCSIEEFRKHMELQFSAGMTWSKYGKTGWHIDHIVPLANFNLADVEQLRAACHYSNLQPLWATENLKKSNRSV